LPPDDPIAPPPRRIKDELPPDTHPYFDPHDILNGSDQLIESHNCWPFISEDFCTTPSDDFCLTTPPLQHWVCSQYSGGYNQNNVWQGNYNRNEVPAWQPVFDMPVRPFCSCSSLFITATLP
jgi:hypothetical protein